MNKLKFIVKDSYDNIVRGFATEKEARTFITIMGRYDWKIVTQETWWREK